MKLPIIHGEELSSINMRKITVWMNELLWGFLLLCLSCFILSGCKGNEEQEKYDRQAEEKEVVKVMCGRLTPTRSENTSITKARPFLITAPDQGKFIPKVRAGDEVEEGTVLGIMEGEEIKAPVEANIISIEKEGKYPQNYPLLELQYTGFSLNVNAEEFLASIPDHVSLKAKFQIRDITGPEDVLAVVLSENEEGVPEVLQCLISQDISVKQGQNATVVITAETKEDTLLLPISAVAGRIKKGMVNLIANGEEKNTEVLLGANDGAYIEILSGIDEGDEISVVPPNLDLRND